jgi:hypothetical protein
MHCSERGKMIGLFVQCLVLLRMPSIDIIPSLTYGSKIVWNKVHTTVSAITYGSKCMEQGPHQRQRA